MKIGIDISQTAFEKTGTGVFTKNLVEALLKIDKKNEYVLFFSSLRKEMPDIKINERTVVKKFKIPPSVLSFLWNKLHKFPIERFIGDVDVFITSDWTEPPVRKAKKASIIYDLIIYRHPKETHEKIIKTQRMKLKWLKKEDDVIFCISESTKNDVSEILNIDRKKLKVIYPGL